MHDDTFQLILKVSVGDSTVKQDSLIIVQVFHSQILIIHLLDKVLPRYILLTVWLHV